MSFIDGSPVTQTHCNLLKVSRENWSRHNNSDSFFLTFYAKPLVWLYRSGDFDVVTSHGAQRFSATSGTLKLFDSLQLDIVQRRQAEADLLVEQLCSSLEAK